MAGRAERIGLVVGALLLALPVPAWAGSAQAALAVGVVVQARCAVRVPATMGSGDLPATGAAETVAMRCTKGTLPTTGAGSAAAPGAVGPRVTSTVVLSTSDTAPRPLTETSSPSMVITVNF